MIVNIISFLFVITSCVTAGTIDYYPNVEVIEGGISGDAITTRYWDCCKPSCGWRGNLNDHTANPVTSCAADGVTVLDPEIMAACDPGKNGTSYMCNNQQNYAVNDTFAYGYVAASFTGGVDYSYCCACVLLSFKSGLEGKYMLAQITNAGSDLHANQFDIAIPGGGVGLHNGCDLQWHSGPDGWGDRVMGIDTREECDTLLPEPLRSGCYFRFDFMEGIPNPDVSFKQVKCPKELIANTGCNM
ncbi:endoglucanase [Leptinotarsa decemlineata]|uniref:Cellulase n=1 Tax=Leptinotarsa decemlineata TaxID=7539 RepID=E7CIY9_LEPDE|nr:endoglucanase-like [Leptinotarsa decemlineata]ADU33351.1 endo-beta-1,4-glucanase [Leptinotarsa decemlineata]